MDPATQLKIVGIAERIPRQYSYPPGRRIDFRLTSMRLANGVCSVLVAILEYFRQQQPDLIDRYPLSSHQILLILLGRNIGDS